MGTLHKEVFTFLIISLSGLLVMKNVSDKFIETIKSHKFDFQWSVSAKSTVNPYPANVENMVTS